MAVTLSDAYADGLESRFVGICIHRGEPGLYHNFTLRNVIDKQGIEIMYEMYNPTIKKIEVLYNIYMVYRTYSYSVSNLFIETELASCSFSIYFFITRLLCI